MFYNNDIDDLTLIHIHCTVSKLSPKKWGLSRNSSIVLATFFGGLSYLIDHGVDLRPQLAVVLGLAMVDSIFLGGSCLAQISSYWPPYKRRILVHEAGHLLVGESVSHFYIQIDQKLVNFHICEMCCDTPNMKLQLISWDAPFVA